MKKSELLKACNKLMPGVALMPRVHIGDTAILTAAFVLGSSQPLDYRDKNLDILSEYLRAILRDGGVYHFEAETE